MKNNTANSSQVPKLAIKLNTRIGDLCPLCGNPATGRVGLCVVEDTTDLPVCLECSIQHALELAYAVSMIESARLLAISERDFGVKFESFNFPEYTGGFSPEEIENIKAKATAEVGR
jgi:hypothetical protein